MVVSPQRGGSCRLLFVEDNPHVIDGLRDSFEWPEFECEVALDLRTARDILRERRMDAVVVDATVDSMPRGGVAALIKQFKAADPSMKVVIFNGVRRKAVQRHMRRLGAEGYLSKRSDLKAVERSVRRVVGGER